MKHGLFQRSVSLLLALVMILGNVPMNTLAAEGEETTAPACEHSYDAVTTDATCSQDGSVVYTCACGDTYTETIPATGEHAWGDWTVTAEATYEAAGLETRACGCGATEEREIPQLVAAHEHAWGDWTVAAEATYEAAGLETRACQCGATENREIPQLVKEKAELSGNTRKLYFLNTEAWEEVHVFWSFEEEDFEDVAFPGVKMEADEDLENVFVVELPVEADAVTFNDGVEVTEELKTYERENGIEAIHFFAAELDTERDYFSAAEQVEDENNATEWLSYEDVLAAWEAEIAEVQTMIDALPTAFATQEEVDAFWTSTEALDAAIEALTEAQQEKLDQSNYDAAIDAAAAFTNPEFDNDATWAHIDGWYWSDDRTTLYVKDGAAFDLYDAIKEHSDASNVNTLKYHTSELTWRNARKNGTAISDGQNVTLEPKTFYYGVDTSGTWAYHAIFGSFNVVYYYSLSVAIAEGSPLGAGIEISAGRVFGNDTVEITVENVDGYTATVIDSKGIVVTNLAAYKPTESTTLTVTYTSNEVTKYEVKLEEDAASRDWGTATLKSDDELIAGANVLVEVVANANDANHKYEIVSVKVGDTELSKNENGYYVYTMGEADATITVTYSKTSIEKNTNIATVGFNPKKTVSAQADVLKQNIFTAVVNAGASLPEGIAVNDVNIQYIPWYKGNLSHDYKHSYGGILGAGAFGEVAHDLTAAPTSRDSHTGYTFGQTFAEGTQTYEKVKLTGTGKWADLYIEAEITLKDARDSMPVVNATTAESKDGAAGILAAAKAAAAAAYSGYENLEFAITTENWEATVDGLAAGATTDVTVQATFAGDADKIGGTVTVTVAVTKSAVLAAEVTYTENVDGGDVALTKGANNAALGNGVMAADNPVHVTVNNFKYGSTNAEAYYLDGISVNGNPLTVANNAASFEVENSVDEVKNYTVVVSYEKETFSIATTGYEIKINGFSNETKSVDLKKLVLDEIFSEGNYNGEDYKVEMKTSYTLDLGELGSYDLAEGYYDVTGYTFNFLGERHLPASWFVGKLNTDGVTLNNFKITKLGSSNRSGKDLYKEDVMIVASEAREETDNITLSDLDYTENTLADVIAAIKNNVRVNGETANVNVTLAPETALTTAKQTYTATVTAPATANYLESSKAFTITANATAFTVTWIADGVTVDTETVVYGGNATKTPGVPAKEGHTGKWVGNTTNIKAETEIVANYSANKYTITWTINGEAYDVPVEVTYGTAVKAPAYTTPEGHSFSGWAIPETMPAKDITLDATLTVNSYDVIWVWQNAEGEQTTTVTLPYGTAIQVPAEIPAQYTDGNVTYTRTGWTGLTDGATVPVDGITYTATYTEATAWIVDFNSDGGTEVVDVTVIVPEGETVTVAKPTDPTREGYRFDGWLLNGKAYDFKTPVTADITLTAKWQKTYTATFETEHYTAPEAKTVDAGETIEIPALLAGEENDNIVMIGWFIGDEKVEDQFTMNEDILITAKWVADTNNNGKEDAQETVTITANEGGSFTVNGETLVGDNYLYDSTQVTKLTIVATPKMNGNMSATYVKSITYHGNPLELAYNKYVATATVSLNAPIAPIADEEAQGPDIEVIFEEAKFTYTVDRKMPFYAGMETPTYEKLYNAVIEAPVYNADAVKSVKYLARKADKYTIDLSAVREALDEAGGLASLAVYAFDAAFPNQTMEISLKDNWLDVGTELSEGTIQDVIDKEVGVIIENISKGNWSDLVSNLKKIGSNISETATTIGCHEFGAFGYNQETLQVIYESDVMHIEDNTIVVNLYDNREESFIQADNITVYYRDYTPESLVEAIAPKLVDANGEPINGDIQLITNISGKEVVGDKPITFSYKGDTTYQPTETTITVTIAKAPVTVNVPNTIATYGDGAKAAPTFTNRKGEEVEVEAYQFMLALDVANFNIDGNAVSGLNGKVQLILPESIQTAVELIPGLSGEHSLDDLMKILNSSSGVLEGLGLSKDILDTLNSVLNSITGITETGNLTIVIGGDYMENVGAYLVGAVTSDANYETAYGIGYLVIAPKTTEHVLEWNDPSLTNALVTLPVFRNMDKGASVVGSEVKDMEVSYLILGINDETGDIYTTDIYGNINLNIWRNPEAITGNGGYVQMAYGIEWGNEFEYAKPIVRSFAIVPGLTELEIVVDNQPSADLYKTVFDNAPVDVTVSGEIPEGSQVKLHYYGIEANTKTYDSDVAPTHTGAYAITATLVTRDAATGEMTSVGLDVATVVIQPTESSVTVKELETVTYDGQNHKVSEVMEIVASSTAENLKPDTTVITASIATDGSFSENGWAAAQGTVNVDFPRWMDELIAKYAPSVKDGITLSELEAKLLNKLPTITDKLEELGATNEMVNSTKNLLTNVSSLLEEMPADAVLSFKDNYEVLAVGTYAVAAVVTDSDHIPSVDAGLLVIVPDADQVFLDWDYHDENNIWSRELLSNVSINATAFNDKAFTEPNAQATAKITYQFIGLDQDAGLKIYTDPTQLPNGIYTQIAYIELEVDSQIVLSDIITRTIVIVPNMPELQIVDSRGAAQDKFEFTFDNEPVELYVKQNGQTIENQIRYIGLQTNGVEYDSTVAPVHAGAYAAITVLKTQENVGMDVALVTIAPAKANISVTGGTVAYDGMEHTATVKSESPDSTVTSPDYTLISGTVDISAGVQNVGLESLYGDVNIDLPKWLDDVLAETEFNRVDADVASVAKFISTYRNDLLKLIPDQMLESAGLSTETVEAIMQKLNGGIDELLKVLDKLPDNVHLTFESNKGYTELGSYFYYGIVTDSDHIPAADTGLLVIVPATITADDVEVTSQHVYNGKEQTVTVEIKVGDKILEAGRDYEVTGNTATNAGEYVMTVIGKGNYAGELSVEWSIEKAPVEVTLSDMTKTYGDGDPTLTYTVKGLTDGDSAANLNIAATRKPGENVGTYVITATAENANYNITIINGTFTITKANAMVADAPAVKELTYTGEDQLLVDAGRSNDGKLMYSLDQNGEYTENIPTGKDANEYTVWYYVAGDANHEDSAKQSVKVIIKSKSITDVAVSLDGKPTFNGTAYVQNVIVKDGEYVLNLNDYEIIGNTATGAGKYTLTVKGKGNYAGEVKIEWSFGDGYPIYFQSGDANGMIHAETTVFVDDVAYVLDENCVAWAADKNRELAIGYVYKNSGNHITDYAHSDTTKNMYIWDLQWNEETKSYKADRVEELDNLLSFAGGSIWLGSDGVNGIRTYYSTTADTEAVKGAFRNLGYEVVTHGIVVGWADKLNGSEPVPNGNNSASGHAVGNGTFYDEIYPAADKYITPDLRARFYVELKNIETSESKIIYSGSVERSIGYIAYQNIGRVDAQYQPYVKAILDKAAAAGYTYGNY